jgi:hypothetical protein
MFLAGDPKLAVDLRELDEHLILRIEMVQRQDGAVHRLGAPVARNDIDLSLGKGVPRIQGSFQTLFNLMVGAGKEVQSMVSDHVSRADLKEHLGGGIEVKET